MFNISTYLNTYTVVGYRTNDNVVIVYIFAVRRITVYEYEISPFF